MSRKLTTEEFVTRATIAHGDKYDYSDTKYTSTRGNVQVVCPSHGVFSIRASSHIQGEGCRKCGYQSRTLTSEDYITRCRDVHGDKYNYDNVQYENATSKVCVICKLHGEFHQQAYAHLTGQGCPQCYEESKALSKEQFIKNAKLRHGDTYDYSAVNYSNSHSDVDIICPKHGMFTQRAYAHMYGQGCPACNESKGERLIRNTLKQLVVEFESQKSFNDLMSPKGASMYYDFFIPSRGILIEYDGRQHFESVDAFGGDENFNTAQLYDQLKDAYAIDNNIPLYRYPYTMSDDQIVESLKNILTTGETNGLLDPE